MRRSITIALLSMLILPFLLQAADKELDSFWSDFKLALISSNKQKVADMSLLSGNDERKSFYSDFNSIFDTTATKAIVGTPSDRLIKSARPDDNDSESVLAGIPLPKEIKEIYYIVVLYSINLKDEQREFRQAYIVAKVSGSYKFIGSYTLD